MNAIRVQAVDHREPAIAAGIHAVQMAAYAQEAELLGVRDFPPLRATVRDVQQSGAMYIAAFVGETIVGTIGVEPPEIADWSGQKLDTFHIATLVVLPANQRQGIGRQLVRAAIATHSPHAMSVSTAIANTPALSLYAQFGFIACTTRTVGHEPLQIVLMRRDPHSP